MSAPRSGDTITYTKPSGPAILAKAIRVEGNLCWTDYGDGEPQPFIWRFKDGLNTMHSWPGKPTQ